VAVALAEHIRQFPLQRVTLPWKSPSGKPVAVQLLVTMRSGKVIEQNSWNPTAWHRARKAAGIEPRPGREAGYHQLRHYYASSLLAPGVDIKALSEALGHSDPGFTLGTYARLMPSAGDRVRAAIDRRDTGSSPAQKTETGW
jgi:integrase